MQERKEVDVPSADFSPRPVETAIFVAIGGNLGDREATFVGALRALEREPDLKVIGLSPVFETDAVGPGDQPPYLNAVLRLESRLAPIALLAVLQRLELAAGRDRSPDAIRWGARILDLDLLFFGSMRLSMPDLVLPHPRADERAFVLRPMAALAPRFVHPVLDRSMEALLSGRPAQEEFTVRKFPDPDGWYVAE